MKPKFYNNETDPANAALRRQVKELNEIIHKEGKNREDKKLLKKLLSERNHLR